ncbi:MAG: hypothetical protein V3S10_06505 [Dehalococcoidales bacterium]
MLKWLFGASGGQSGKKPAKDEPTSQKLWDTEFSIVAKGGLNPEQVVAYVEDLNTRHQASQDAQVASVRSIVQTAIGDAHEIAEKIRGKAEKDAETTASGIVADAEKDAEAVRRKAETEAKQTTERMTANADKRAHATEAEAQDKAVLFLLRAREQIEREVVGEFNEAYSRLTGALETLVSQGQELQADLQGRREGLLKSKVFELTGADVPLIGSPAESAGEDAADAETSSAEPTAAEEPAPTVDAKEASSDAEETTVDADAASNEEAEPAAEGVAATAEDPVIVESEIELPEAADAAASGDEAFSELTEEETQALYIGEVDIVVPTPVDAKMMSQLHRYLQTTPEIKLVRTAGSMGRGTVVTIAIDKPVPLIGALSSKIPDATIALERHRGGGSPGLPGATKKIRMVPKTA